jgi:hypothetical protein
LLPTPSRHFVGNIPNEGFHPPFISDWLTLDFVLGFWVHPLRSAALELSIVQACPAVHGIPLSEAGKIQNIR